MNNTETNIPSDGNPGFKSLERFFNLPAGALVPTSEPTLKYVRADDKSWQNHDAIGGDRD